MTDQLATMLQRKVRCSFFELSAMRGVTESLTRPCVADVMCKAVSKDEEYLNELFPDFEEGIRQPTTKEWSMKQPENFNHSGRNCGRKFNVDEPIYRCLDCGFDDTCVLCVRCFNKDDHAGHQVTIAIATETNSGICDCGDAEAWKKDIHCKCEETKISKKDRLTFNDEYKKYLKSYFESCLEYIILVFAHQNQCLLSTHKTLAVKGNTHAEDDLKHTQKVMDSIFRPETDEHVYMLVFWNDEVHNYQEAQLAIEECGDMYEDESFQYAKFINDDGRFILSHSANAETELKRFHLSHKMGFPGTFTNSQTYFKEDIAHHMINWFKTVLNHPNRAFQKIFRSALCEALCGEFELPAELAPYWQKSKLVPGSDYDGLLRGSKLPSDFATTKNGVTLKAPVFGSTRLKYLLFFEPRYWKAMRSSMHEFLVSALLSDLEYKKIAAQQTVDIYGILLQNMFYVDREPMISFLDDFGLQFLSCPKTATAISTTSLDRLMASCADVLSRMLQPMKPTIRISHQGNDRRLQMRMTQTTILRTLKFILEKTTSLASLFEASTFYSFCKMISYCDRCYEIQRKEGEHVVIESMDFILYREIVYPILDLIDTATQDDSLKRADSQKLRTCTLTLLKSLYDGVKFRNSLDNQKLIKFRVSSQESGFYFPSHFLLGRLLAFTSSDVDSLKEIVSSVNFTDIADESLRRIVLNTQIESRFWIRNGTTALNMAASYTEHDRHIHGDDPYTTDIYLNQVALCTQDPERYFLNLLSRFELLRWLDGLPLDETVYEGKVFSVMEHFICFLYALLSHREPYLKFESPEARTEHRFREVLRYMLCLKPLSYTQIEDTFDEDTLSNEVFERCLTDITIFSPPKGFQDEGMYTLKEEEYKFLDPLHLVAQLNDVSNNITLIAKHIAGENNYEGLILKPQLEPIPQFAQEIGAFTRTESFARFVKRLMNRALHSGDETNVPILLHLLHAALVDADLAHCDEPIPDVYLTSGIYKTIFSMISNSKFSKAVIHKADFILETFLLKSNTAVTQGLVEEFGQEPVDLYKKQKESSGVLFDETDVDRKKRLAKQRQQRLFNKMKKKQNAFITNNDVGSPDDSSTPNDHHPTMRQCVICQGFESAEKLILTPMNFFSSNVFWKLPFCDEVFSEDPYYNRAFLKWGDDTFEPKDGYIGKPFGREYPFHETVRSLVGLSCNHGFHYSCLSEFRTNEGHDSEFGCPLCKVRHGWYIPVLPCQEITMEMLCNSNRNISFGSKLLRKGFQSQSDEVRQQLTEAHDAIAESFPWDCTKLNKVTNMWGIFGSTISQAEISTRINGNSAYTEFLNQIPEQTFITLRALFQYSLLVHQDGIESLHKIQDLLLGRTIPYRGFIHTFIIFFFSCSLDFKQLVRRLVVIYADKYIQLLEPAIPSDLEPFLNVGPDLVKAFKTLLTSDIRGYAVDPEEIEETFRTDLLASQYITMVERLLIVDLRSILIFLKVLIPDFKFVAPADEPFSIDSLLTALGLESFKDIIAHKSNHCLLPIVLSRPYDRPRYPGVIKFLDLPRELNYFSTAIGDSFDNSVFPTTAPLDKVINRMDFLICLTCGTKQYNLDTSKDFSKHFEGSCSSTSTGIFFNPSTDEVKLWSKRLGKFYNRTLKGPYVNSHGQSGRNAVANGRVATLSTERLKHLTTMWLTGGIYPFLTRVEVPKLILGTHTNQYAGLWNALLADPNANDLPLGIDEGFIDLVQGVGTDRVIDFAINRQNEFFDDIVRFGSDYEDDESGKEDDHQYSYPNHRTDRADIACDVFQSIYPERDIGLDIGDQDMSSDGDNDSEQSDQESDTDDFDDSNRHENNDDDDEEDHGSIRPGSNLSQHQDSANNSDFQCSSLESDWTDNPDYVGSENEESDDHADFFQSDPASPADVLHRPLNSGGVSGSSPPATSSTELRTPIYNPVIPSTTVSAAVTEDTLIPTRGERPVSETTRAEGLEGTFRRGFLNRSSLPDIIGSSEPSRVSPSTLRAEGRAPVNQSTDSASSTGSSSSARHGRPTPVLVEDPTPEIRTYGPTDCFNRIHVPRERVAPSTTEQSSSTGDGRSEQTTEHTVSTQGDIPLDIWHRIRVTEGDGRRTTAHSHSHSHSPSNDRSDSHIASADEYQIFYDMLIDYAETGTLRHDAFDFLFNVIERDHPINAEEVFDLWLDNAFLLGPRFRSYLFNIHGHSYGGTRNINESTAPTTSTTSSSSGNGVSARHAQSEPRSSHPPNSSTTTVSSATSAAADTSIPARSTSGLNEELRHGFQARRGGFFESIRDRDEDEPRVSSISPASGSVAQRPPAASGTPASATRTNEASTGSRPSVAPVPNTAASRPAVSRPAVATQTPRTQGSRSGTSESFTDQTTVALPESEIPPEFADNPVGYLVELVNAVFARATQGLPISLADRQFLLEAGIGPGLDVVDEMLALARSTGPSFMDAILDLAARTIQSDTSQVAQPSSPNATRSSTAAAPVPVFASPSSATRQQVSNSTPGDMSTQAVDGVTHQTATPRAATTAPSVSTTGETLNDRLRRGFQGRRSGFFNSIRDDDEERDGQNPRSRNSTSVPGQVQEGTTGTSVHSNSSSVSSGPGGQAASTGPTGSNNGSSTSDSRQHDRRTTTSPITTSNAAGRSRTDATSSNASQSSSAPSSAPGSRRSSNRSGAATRSTTSGQNGRQQPTTSPEPPRRRPQTRSQTRARREQLDLMDLGPEYPDIRELAGAWLGGYDATDGTELQPAVMGDEANEAYVQYYEMVAAALHDVPTEVIDEANSWMSPSERRTLFRQSLRLHGIVLSEQELDDMYGDRF